MATSIRVGNELGAGNPTSAKRASYIAIGIICESFVKYYINNFDMYGCNGYELIDAVCVAVFYTILLMSIKDVLGYLFVPGNE